jgi:hypothetical protein
VRKMSMFGPNQQRGWNIPREKSSLMMPRRNPRKSDTVKTSGAQASDAEVWDHRSSNSGTLGPAAEAQRYLVSR